MEIKIVKIDSIFIKLADQTLLLPQPPQNLSWSLYFQPQPVQNLGRAEEVFCYGIFIDFTGTDDAWVDDTGPEGLLT